MKTKICAACAAAVGATSAMATEPQQVGPLMTWNPPAPRNGGYKVRK